MNNLSRFKLRDHLKILRTTCCTLHTNEPGHVEQLYVATEDGNRERVLTPTKIAVRIPT